MSGMFSMESEGGVMFVIHKYPLPLQDAQNLRVPNGTQILTVQVQAGVPCLWVLKDMTQKIEENIYINIYETGREILRKPGKYIGTYQVNNGQYVFHVFEEVK